MNNNIQTIKFVVAAAVVAGLAGLTSFLSRPTPIDDFANVGEPFFEDFKDSTLATAVRVVAYNEDTASSRVFNVAKQEGTWRIPSHHNYPADGEDRLGKTSKTLIGVKRGAVASRVAADHERFGVVNPLDDGTDTLKGRGQRLTLYKGEKNDIAVADLIIGKKLPEGENRYYVRHPEEKETYITELEVDISTKFSDWVEADLLKLDRDDLTRIQSRSTKVEGQEYAEIVDATLTRAKLSDPWALDGINEETEEVNKDDISAMVNVIDNLKLSGVRRKPELAGKPILRGDLGIMLPPGADRDPQIVRSVIEMVQRSLVSKGFEVYQKRETNDIRLYAQAGELIASLKDGVQFHMSFGNQFEGSSDEIEIGGTVAEAEDEDKGSDKEQKPAGPPGSEEDKDEDANDEEKDDTDKDEKKTKSRYLIVRASFDEDLLDPKLIVPVKPNVPEGVEVDEDENVVKPVEEAPAKVDEVEATKDTAAETEDDDATEKADDSEKPADAADSADAATPDAAKPDAAKPDAAKPDAAKPDAAKPEDAKPEDAKPEDAKPEDAKPDDAKPDDAAAEEKKEEGPNLGDIYQRAIEKYRSDQKKYESDVKDREQRIEEGQKKVDELNERFADWYYVITEEDFGKLRLNRDQLVKLKVKEEPGPGDGEAGAAAPAAPGSNPAASVLTVPPGTAKPATPADAAKTPAGDAAKPDAAKPDAAKPDAAKPDAAKPDAAKPDAAKPDAAKPDAAKPDAAKPDAAKPDAAKPDAAKPDAAKPDAAKPDAAKPDAAKPDAAKPDAAKPDATKPDATKPDAAKPDAAKPDAAKPDAAKPAAPKPAPAETKPEPAKPAPPAEKKPADKDGN